MDYLVTFLCGSFLTGVIAYVWHSSIVSELKDYHKARMKVNMDRARAAGWNDCAIAHRDKGYAKI